MSILFTVPATVTANWFGSDFSADIYQQFAQQQQLGRMYVGHGKVRIDIQHDQTTIVELVDPEQGMSWTLDLQQRRYQQHPLPFQGRPDEHLRGNPCAMLHGARCELLGQEVLYGRNSNKWQTEIAGQTGMQWIDTIHHFPVRIEMAGEVQLEMKYEAQEMLQGREVERWRSRSQTPNGLMLATQWYDPLLNIAIRQHMGDGSVRELRNIRMESPAPSLFVVPADFRPFQVGD